MEGRKLTGFAVIMAIFLIVFIAVCMLCSCSTKQKTITEYVTVHDSIRVYKIDTLREIKAVKETIHDTTIVQVRDTIIHESGKVITLNEHGDTIKEKSWDNLWQKIQEQLQSNHVDVHSDSTDYYHARSDSLESALHKEQSKYKEIVKTKHIVSWWEWLVIFGIVVALLYGVRLSRKYNKARWRE